MASTRTNTTLHHDTTISKGINYTTREKINNNSAIGSKQRRKSDHKMTSDNQSLQDQFNMLLRKLRRSSMASRKLRNKNSQET